ncbi:hypothetical protein [Chryseobacterium arachidis]
MSFWKDLKKKRIKKIEIFSNGDTRKTAFWQEADICCTKVKRNGLWDKVTEQKFLFLPVSRSGKKAYCLSDELRKNLQSKHHKICCYAQVGALVQKNVEESGFKSFTTLKKERLPATTAIFLIILRREALTLQQNPLMQK